MSHMQDTGPATPAAVLVPVILFFLTYPRLITVWAVLFTLCVSAGYMLLLGQPCIWLLRKLQLYHWWSMAIAGFLAGFLPLVILDGWPYFPYLTTNFDNHTWTENLASLLSLFTLAWKRYYFTYGVYGSAAALTYWKVRSLWQQAGADA